MAKLEVSEVGSTIFLQERPEVEVIAYFDVITFSHTHPDVGFKFSR